MAAAIAESHCSAGETSAAGAAVRAFQAGLGCVISGSLRYMRSARPYSIVLWQYVVVWPERAAHAIAAS